MNTDAKETIRAKLPIESVVGSYVKLEKSGNNFRACCPFHHEKSPSFYVTPSLGIYKCFGCHKGGDIFRFVEEIENIPFLEALRMLAEKAGVSLDDYKNEKPSKMAVLREIMDNAAKFYEVGLRTNPDVVKYLESRGMTKETMVAWRIGYGPKDWSKLYEYLKGKKYTDEDILATGMCLKGKQAGLYDRFRERIMFPINDSQGRVIAFTGRIMPGTEEASRPT
jgi:DNA primase